MKKIVSVLIIVVSFVAIVPAQAQLIKFGVKGGLNLATSLSGAWSDAANTDNYTGFFIGPMVDITIPIVGLGVDGALMYSQKGNKIGDSTFKQQGAEIPLNLKYTFGLGSLASIYLAAGPSFFFNMNSKDDLTIENEVGEIKYEKSEVAINLGGGVKLLKHLQIGVNYNMPLTNSAKANFNAISALQGKSYKTKMWQVSLAYIF